jgi:hypothetical protein
MDPIGPEGDVRFVTQNVQSLNNAINPPTPPAASPSKPVVAGPDDPAPDEDAEEAA